MFPPFSSTLFLWYVVKTQFWVSSFIPITEGNTALLYSWYLCICVMAVCGYPRACYLGHHGGLSLTLDSGVPGLHKFWVPLMASVGKPSGSRWWCLPRICHLEHFPETKLPTFVGYFLCIYWKEIVRILIKCHWGLFFSVQLTISHWFR